MSTPKDDDGTHPDIPDKGWTNPFPEGHALHDLYERRISNGQDLVILIDDYHSRRGTGKTVGSLQLAQGMDQNGPLTWENVSMSPRVEEKYVIVNTPSIGHIDKNLRELADVWISMVRMGLGLVHFFKRQPYGNQGSGTLLTPLEGMIQFEDIEKGTQLRSVYNQLTEEKRKHISGDKGGGFIPQSEHQEQMQKAREEARKEMRDEIITDVYRGLSGFDDDDYTRMKRADGVSQAMLGEAVGLSQQQIANIVRDN